ncbi:MAG: hypothetical protein U9R34_06370 [Nanoarchaeota archaeon]|nr:hypothetical protein [Nanoarchaeota archaeon]
MNNKPLNLTLIAILVLVILLTSCGCFQSTVQLKDNISDNTPSTKNNNPTIPVETEDTSTYYEITKTDIFAIENLTADKIKVLDIKVGDSADFMLETLGDPDNLTAYDNHTIFNSEYGESIGINGIGLIFNIEGNTIKRITILKPFNPFLRGSTKFFIMNMTKYDAYRMFGTPDRQMEEPKTRVFFYDETGIDILLFGKDVKGFSLRQPDKKPIKTIPKGF